MWPAPAFYELPQILLSKLAGIYDDLDAHSHVSDVLDEDATARKLAATREALDKQRKANEALKSELSAATEVRAYIIVKHREKHRKQWVD